MQTLNIRQNKQFNETEKRSLKTNFERQFDNKKK